MEVILACVIIMLGFYLYLLPSFVGKFKKNSKAILILNIFLGWTYVGWVIALVWAVMEDC